MSPNKLETLPSEILDACAEYLDRESRKTGWIAGCGWSPGVIHIDVSQLLRKNFKLFISKLLGSLYILFTVLLLTGKK